MDYDDVLFIGGKCKRIYNISLNELEKEVREINNKQNTLCLMSTCGLNSGSIEIIVHKIRELQEHKKELLKLMHKKVDEL